MRLQPMFPVLLARLAWLASATLTGSLSAAAADGKYTVAELKEAAPEPLADEIRNVLGKAGYRIQGAGGKNVCDVWLRNELPVLDKTPEALVMYPIEPGTLVGAFRFPAAGSDYRNQKIKAGVYTLRYGYQPQDGNHLGTADYRDFLILVQAGEDKSAAKVTQEQVMDLSKKVSGSTHPAILSLLPPQKGRDKLPLIVHQDTLELEVLVAKTTGKSGSKIQDVQIELVAIGHAAE